MKLVNFLLTNILVVASVFAILLITLMAISNIGEPRFCSCGDVYTWKDVAALFLALTVPFCLGYLTRNPDDRTILDD